VDEVHVLSVKGGHGRSRHLCRRVHGESPIEARDPLEMRGNEADVMADNDDGELFIQGMEEVRQILFDIGINSCRGFIQKQQFGFSGEGPRY